MRDGRQHTILLKKQWTSRDLIRFRRIKHPIINGASMIPIEDSRQQAPFVRNKVLQGYSGFSFPMISIHRKNSQGSITPASTAFPCQILTMVKVSELYTDYPENQTRTLQRSINIPFFPISSLKRRLLYWYNTKYARKRKTAENTVCATIAG